MLDTRPSIVSSLAAEQALCIRDTHALLCAGGLAPDAPWHAIEALLAVGAYESAALALLGYDMAYMLSRSSDGVSLATLVAPVSGAEVTGQGRTPALALAAALAAMIGEYEAQYRLADAWIDPIRVPVLH